MPPREQSSGTLALRRVLRGFEHFHDCFFEGDSQLYERLVSEGQSPRVMVIACSDSRSDPALLTEAQPGDLFVIRNVAALVPAYEAPQGVPKGTSAAIEFGVRALEVDHIIILGHSHCGGIRFLAERRGRRDNFEFLPDWVSVASSIVDRMENLASEAGEAERLRWLERSAVALSVRNLQGFPWIAERIRASKLALHGWHFDLQHGQIQALDASSGRFHAVKAGELPAAACGCCEGLMGLVTGC